MVVRVHDRQTRPGSPKGAVKPRGAGNGKAVNPWELVAPPPADSFISGAPAQQVAPSAPVRERAGTAETQVVNDGYKRPFDLALVILSHLFLLPLWALLWVLIPLAIKLDDGGPVFYVQTRLGRNGKRFKIIKFRSMIRDAESRTGAVWAVEGDRRVTRVGRVLRKTHLDELPQIINVVKGDLSIVGPRPERPALAEQFSRQVTGFSQRLRVQPGITGLAQVRGKYSTLPCNKLKYDNLYIKTMSPWTDIRLIFLTAWVVLGIRFPTHSHRETGQRRDGGLNSRA